MSLFIFRVAVVLFAAVLSGCGSSSGGAKADSPDPSAKSSSSSSSSAGSSPGSATSEAKSPSTPSCGVFKVSGVGKAAGVHLVARKVPQTPKAKPTDVNCEWSSKSGEAGFFIRLSARTEPQKKLDKYVKNISGAQFGCTTKAGEPAGLPAGSTLIVCDSKTLGRSVFAVRRAGDRSVVCGGLATTTKVTLAQVQDPVMKLCLDFFAKIS